MDSCGSGEWALQGSGSGLLGQRGLHQAAGGLRSDVQLIKAAGLDLSDRTNCFVRFKPEPGPET